MQTPTRVILNCFHVKFCGSPSLLPLKMIASKSLSEETSYLFPWDDEGRLRKQHWLFPDWLQRHSISAHWSGQSSAASVQLEVTANQQSIQIPSRPAAPGRRPHPSKPVCRQHEWCLLLPFKMLWYQSSQHPNFKSLRYLRVSQQFQLGDQKRNE